MRITSGARSFPIPLNIPIGSVDITNLNVGNMKKNIKYTTDGRKVVVIGELNKSETIVQEVFVTDDGTEIPAGDRFVVKNLLSKPAKPWKQQELESLDKRYNDEKKAWEAKFNALREEKELAYKALYSRVKWLRNVVKEPHSEDFKDAITVLANFLSNENKWVVVKDYARYYLQPFNDEGVNKLDDLTSDHRGLRYDSMRLLSLYGDSAGRLTYRIDRFSDGSGNSEDVMFFSDRDSALSYLQVRVDETETYTSSTIEMAKDYGLSLNKEKLLDYQRQLCDRYNRQIKEAEDCIKKYKDLLNDVAMLSVDVNTY